MTLVTGVCHQTISKEPHVPNQVVDNDILEVKVYCQAAEQLAINILHFHVLPPGTGPITDKEIAAHLDANLVAFYIAIMAPTASYIGLTVQVVGGSTPKPYVVSNVHTAVGTVAGDLMPRQTAGLVTKLTNGIGRSNRGRIYLPFPGEADNQSTGIPTAGYVARMTNLTNYLTSAITAVGAGGNAKLQIILRHRLTGLYTDMNGVRNNQKWGTQRRRGSYGRPNTLPVGF